MSETPSIEERLLRRVLPKHGGTGNPLLEHWNLTDGDSELHRDAAQALSAVTRERDLFYAALDCLARLGNEPCLGNSRGNQIAQDALGGRYIAEVEHEQKKRNAERDALRAEVERLRDELKRIAAYPTKREDELSIAAARDMARAALTPAEVKALDAAKRRSHTLVAMPVAVEPAEVKHDD